MVAPKFIHLTLLSLALALTGMALASVTLEVEAERDSRVFLDGSFVGVVDDTGSFSLADVSKGEHTVMLVHPERRPQSQKVTLQPGEVRLVQFGASPPLTPPTLERGERAGQIAKPDWVPSMGWGLAAMLALFALTIAASGALIAKLFPRK